MCCTNSYKKAESDLELKSKKTNKQKNLFSKKKKKKIICWTQILQTLDTYISYLDIRKKFLSVRKI